MFVEILLYITIGLFVLTIIIFEIMVRELVKEIKKANRNIDEYEMLLNNAIKKLEESEGEEEEE